MASRVLVSSQPYTDSSGRAGTLHSYSDGTHVFVPKPTPISQVQAAIDPNGFGSAQPAQPAAAPAATPAAPPTPAPTPAVDPYYTPEDLLNINTFTSGQSTQRADIKRSLDDLTTDTTYQKGQLDDQARKATGAAQENAAARGLQQSSINDANVYDIEAQRRINQQLLDDKLTTARLDARSRIHTLDDSQTDFNKTMAGKAVQNAQAVDVTPPPAAAPAAAAPANPHGTLTVGPLQKNSLGHNGRWHSYSDGYRVWVPA